MDDDIWADFGRLVALIKKSSPQPGFWIQGMLQVTFFLKYKENIARCLSASEVIFICYCSWRIMHLQQYSLTDQLSFT